MESPKLDPLHFGLTKEQLELSDRAAALWCALEGMSDDMSNKGKPTIYVGKVERDDGGITTQISAMRVRKRRPNGPKKHKK